MSTLTVERLYHPDGQHLGALLSGLSGSGKTTAVISTLQAAGRSKTFGEFHRFVIIDPKNQPGDYDKLADPITDLEQAMKSVREEKYTVYWPDVDFLETDVSHMVDYIFDLAESEPRSSYTVILDEASILITPTKIPPSLKRLSVQGRAKRIKPVFLSQRPIVNRWTDANLSTMLLFRTLPVDADTLGRRWGVDFHAAEARLREQRFSFLWFDLETGDIKPVNPVPMPKALPRNKKSIWANIF